MQAGGKRNSPVQQPTGGFLFSFVECCCFSSTLFNVLIIVNVLFSTLTALL